MHPILVVGYKRSDLLERTLEMVRLHGAGPVYINIDAARNVSDLPGVEKTLKVANSFVDKYSYGVTVRLLEKNHGPDLAIPSAINWVLSQHEKVIVLEDDCLPHATFFPFMNELLDRYENDPRIFMISGDNFLPAGYQAQWPCSYFFGRQAWTWGWATWRRAWVHYSGSLSQFDGPEFPLISKSSFYGNRIDRHWHRLASFHRANPSETTWDSAWTLAIALQNGLSIVPRVNLVRNIGFGNDATHTTRNYLYQVKSRQRISFPLLHPTTMVPWRWADEYMFDRIQSKSPWPRLRRFLLRVDPDQVALKDES